MGKMAFKGPVYGAKTLLFSASITTVSSGASSAVILSWVLPTYQDYYITEMHTYCSTASSGGNTFTLKSEGGTTTILPRAETVGNGSTRAQTIITQAMGGSTTGPFLSAATPDPGEYEGAWVPAGSSLRLLGSSIANPISNFVVNIHGFIRFISSTRAEA